MNSISHHPLWPTNMAIVYTRSTAAGIHESLYFFNVCGLLWASVGFCGHVEKNRWTSTLYGLPWAEQMHSKIFLPTAFSFWHPRTATICQRWSMLINTKLNIRSAYNQVHIRQWDEWKTAFSPTAGHYKYLVMPYGLSSAPSVFQRLISDVLRGTFVIAYIDNILIYSPSLESHVSHVCQVRQHLLRQNSMLKGRSTTFIREP